MFTKKITGNNLQVEIKIQKERKLTEGEIQQSKTNNNIDTEVVKMTLAYIAEGKCKFLGHFGREDNLRLHSS